VYEGIFYSSLVSIGEWASRGLWLEETSISSVIRSRLKAEHSLSSWC